MARTPVTNAQFQKFLDETGYEPSQDPRFRPETFLAHWTKKGTIPRGKENHPVTWVSFIDAVNYCEWAGMTLPTEWLWQKAARGPKGYTFPWGDTAPTKKLANYQSKGTTPVEQFAHIRTPYGCIDMIGNVSEWCQLVGHDYSKMPIELPSVEVTEGDLVGDLDNQRIVKGGCYLRTSNETLTVWHRRYLAITRRNHWVGFRPAVFGPWCAGEL